ncbi:MAG: 4Fe-4S binding protein [Planctomycetota bacterium]
MPRPLQVSRRCFQILVLALTLVTPILARYGNYLSARQLDKVLTRFDGSVQGRVLGATDGVIRAVVAPDIERGGRPQRDRKGALTAARTLRGSTWSFEILGVSFTDPLAALESVFASRTVRWVLLLGIVIPLLLSILFGRFFCSWVCPAGFLLELTGKLRGVLRFLELPPGKVRLWHGDMYLILVIGLTITFLFGLPFLGYLYPPALLGRELHNGVTIMFDRAEGGWLGFSAAGLTLASWFLIGIALIEIVFGARLWCRALCPGGAVYSLLGSMRLVRVKRSAESCSLCGECVPVCEMGLNPMTDRTGMECDNCGACIAHCPEDALGFHLVGRKGRAPAIDTPAQEAMET